MPVHRLTEKEELLESDRICSIAFVSPWDREEAISAVWKAPISSPRYPLAISQRKGSLPQAFFCPNFKCAMRGTMSPWSG